MRSGLTHRDLARRVKSGSPTQWRAILRRDPCVYCGGDAATVDHIVPRAHGGLTTPDNLAPACLDCNTRKRDLSLLMFLAGHAPVKRSRKAERRERDMRQKANALARAANLGRINAPRWKDT